MRINKFVALATGLSRRAADQAIHAGRVTINGQTAELGDDVDEAGAQTIVRLDDQLLELPEARLTIMLHKPVGYVSSRQGQGSQTIYELLPAEYHALKPVGRLDKDSSGLLLLTNDGALANRLTHPSYGKEKVYEVRLDKPLTDTDKAKIEQGIELQDGLSQLLIKPLGGTNYEVRLSQGRNRQLRRTFAALGYTVTKLHRTKFGEYELADLPVTLYVII